MTDHVHSIRKKADTISDVDFSGTWTNDLGSQMIIKQVGQSVTGKYGTAVGAPGDQDRFDLIGFASNDLLTFSVNFGKHGLAPSRVGWDN